jgi:UDP-glucose 4-epimerase
MSSECSHQTTSWMKHEEDEQRPNNTNNKSIVISEKVLVLFVFVSLSAMVFLSYFPPATTSSLNVLDKNAEEDGLLLPIAKEELEEVMKEEQGR